MRYSIVTIGDLKSREVATLFTRYAQRLSRLSCHAIKDDKHWEEKLFTFLEGKNKVFLLSEDGKQFDSPSFANFCQKEGKDGDELVFVVAAAEGFSTEMKTKYPRVSLSSLTFPHEIAVLLLVEQLYRVETIMAGKPYHK